MAKADKAGNTAKYPLNLPDTAFPMRGDLPKREPVWVADWEKRDLYHTIQNACKGAATVSFCTTARRMPTVKFTSAMP